MSSGVEPGMAVGHGATHCVGLSIGSRPVGESRFVLCSDGVPGALDRDGRDSLTAVVVEAPS